jgi:hypothetical protein
VPFHQDTFGLPNEVTGFHCASQLFVRWAPAIATAA